MDSSLAYDNVITMSYLAIPLRWHYRSTPRGEYYNIAGLGERVMLPSLLRRNSNNNREYSSRQVVIVMSIT